MDTQIVISKVIPIVTANDLSATIYHLDNRSRNCLCILGLRIFLQHIWNMYVRSQTNP